MLQTQNNHEPEGVEASAGGALVVVGAVDGSDVAVEVEVDGFARSVGFDDESDVDLAVSSLSVTRLRTAEADRTSKDVVTDPALKTAPADCFKRSVERVVMMTNAN